MGDRFRELEDRHGIEHPKVEHQGDYVFRVYTAEGPRDFEPSKVEVGLDGTLQLSQAWTLPPRPDLQTGRTLVGMEMRLLALIGPDGRLRGETVEKGSPFPPEKP